MVEAGPGSVSHDKMAFSPEFKVILLGDPGVGKTTFFLRLKEGEFVDTEVRPTASLGVERLERTVTVDGVSVKVHVAAGTVRRPPRLRRIVGAEEESGPPCSCLAVAVR